MIIPFANLNIRNCILFVCGPNKIKYEINSKLIKTHQNIMQFAAAAEATTAEGIMQQLQL